MVRSTPAEMEAEREFFLIAGRYGTNGLRDEYDSFIMRRQGSAALYRPGSIGRVVALRASERGTTVKEYLQELSENKKTFMGLISEL